MSADDTNELTDARLRFILSELFSSPIDGLRSGSSYWMLGLVGIGKNAPRFTNGFHPRLWPESRLYRRWFDFPDLGKKGWAIILRVWDEGSSPKSPGVYDQFPGWVPPERVKEADQWIAFLNQEIRDRLQEAGVTPRTPDPSQGAIPPPAPPGRVPVPSMASGAPSSAADRPTTGAPESPPGPASPLPPASVRRPR